ncbi:MAG: hypothetical protein ACOYOV_00450 [Bacteroidales bacterium]
MLSIKFGITGLHLLMSDFKIVKLLGAPVEINFPGNINYTGAYSNVTAYATGDAVSYLGSSYVALGATTGNIPTNTSFWQLLAEKGNTGPAGPSGTSTFTALTDVPSSYSGQALKTVRVNAGATGLEFTTAVDTDEKVKVSSNDTTAKYLEDAITVSHGTNASTVLAKTTLNDGGDEDVQIQFDISKVNLSLANNTTSDFASKSYADAKVDDSITNGVTTIAPSQNAVFDALATKEPSISSGTTSQYFRGDKTFQTLDKSAVGLGSVDNTSDISKPISTATQNALNLITNVIWTGDYNNGTTYTVGQGVMYNGASFRMVIAIGAAGYPPVAYPANWLQVTDYVSPNDIGLGSVDNTSDADKPISNLTATALSNKVSYSDMQKTQLAYVSPSGSNTTGDGSFARPYLTIAYAISNTSDGATIFLLPGLYTEATVIIPAGTGSRAFRGFSANATELQNGISHTANASNINFNFDSININSATLDETAATNGFIYFTKCWFSVTRVDNNPNVVFTSTESNVNSATLSGSSNVFNEALVLGVIVCDGGFNVFENCKFVTTLQAQGATTIRMLDCESFGIASFVNGTIVSGNTPAWEVDLSTEYLGGFTGAVTKTILANISTALGFTPENVANKSTNTSLGTSDTLYPSQNAVKIYADTAISTAITNHEAAPDPHPQYTTNIQSIVNALIFG